MAVELTDRFCDECGGRVYKLTGMMAFQGPGHLRRSWYGEVRPGEARLGPARRSSPGGVR